MVGSVESELDRDTLQVIATLREALDASGLSQAGFARALGTSPSRLSTYLTGSSRPTAHFLIRANRIGHALATAQQAGLMSAPATATAMRTQARASQTPWIWRMLLQGRDHLVEILARGDQVILDAWEAQPGGAGSEEWTALLAAVTAHTFEEADQTPPAWTTMPPLASPWSPEHPFLSPDRVRDLTPEWLRRRNLYVPARDLVTA